MNKKEKILYCNHNIYIFGLILLSDNFPGIGVITIALFYVI